MHRWKKILISVIFLVTLCGIVYTYYIYNKPARDVTNEKGIEVTATALYDSFNNNEQAANANFLNKAIQVTGEVTNVKKNHDGKTVVYLQSSDPIFGVNCTLKQDAGVIEKGSNIKFKGICTGFLSDVILNEGVLIK